MNESPGACLTMRNLQMRRPHTVLLQFCLAENFEAVVTKTMMRAIGLKRPYRNEDLDFLVTSAELGYVFTSVCFLSVCPSDN